MYRLLTLSFTMVLLIALPLVAADPPAAESTAGQIDANDNSVIIRWPEKEAAPADPPVCSARFTAKSLKAFVEDRPDLLPLPLQLPGEREATLAALDRIDMGKAINEVSDFLSDKFGDRFNPSDSLIRIPVPAEKQVTVDLSDAGLEPFTGPHHRVTGMVLHRITQAEYVSTVYRLLETARTLIDSGQPKYDRTAANHMALLAQDAAEAFKAEVEAAKAAEREAQEIRREVGQALGIYNPETGAFEGDPQWVKESRRFSYVINSETGAFIDRLQPTVQDLNRRLAIAGFPGPAPVLKPGIHFDPDLGDVEILLPKPWMDQFLEGTDTLEQRMAEKLIISIEAVRLTDRDIVDGAVAARLNAQVQGVHKIERFNTQGVLRQVGINSLLAVANQQLQVRTLQQVAAGAYPDGVTPVSISAPQYPPLRTESVATTVGSTFSVGADDIFFDGRQQSYGFSYIGPDGVEHRLGIDVVDSLREFWTRIERNLIVHKIKKDTSKDLTAFKVPVGPDTATYKGIAALISQQDEQLVVATGTGAISEISATAGTWLIIQDFEIAPIPGSSTALTEQELLAIEDRVLLTMWLRDPRTPVDLKQQYLETDTREQLHTMLTDRLELIAPDPIREERSARTYAEVYEERYDLVHESASAEKKEKNSVIALTFYSSQGNIVQTPGTTQLGSANDLTSFTTELRPNIVTPISSFLTKTYDGARGTSPLTGVRKGESNSQEKTMTHLVIRSRFPTIERERADRDEGRFLGYFELPIGREPLSQVDLPFLSSSEHPLERLASFRVGAMFDALQQDKIRNRFELLNPNILEGRVPPEVWKSASTRLMMNRKILSDSPGVEATLVPKFRKRFIVEVRSLLEYDPDFYEAPNSALRNMSQWNDADRIVLALNNSVGKFALKRLMAIIDELGEILVPDEYAEEYLAKTHPCFLCGHKLGYLTDEELQIVRRDAANHYLRFGEIYGDAFMEAVSQIFGLGTYRATSNRALLAGPFRAYRDLVVFDRGGRAMAAGDLPEEAHYQFMLLKNGGYQGELFEPSFLTIEDMTKTDRQFVIHGDEIVER